MNMIPSNMDPLIPKTAAARLRRRRITKKGFQLTIMVAGRPGTGKATFINTLCDSSVVQSEFSDYLKLRKNKVELEESDGTAITLNVIDTVGFGERIDNTSHVETLLAYLEQQFDQVLVEEARIERDPRFEDTRVHVCLYFLPPNPRGMNYLDIHAISDLSKRVNVIPVIGKADTLTDNELLEAKKSVMADVDHYGIPIFSFNYDLEDPDSISENNALREMLPFAVVGSNRVFEVGDEKVRGREYKWGFVRVDDFENSEFVALRSVLLGSHIQELRDSTIGLLYERYRTERLQRNPKLLSEIREGVTV